MPILTNGNTINTYGIFTPQQRIIGSGDALAGKTVSWVDTDTLVLNNFGRIGFRAGFTDGTVALVIGDPKH